MLSLKLRRWAVSVSFLLANPRDATQANASRHKRRTYASVLGHDRMHGYRPKKAPIKPMRQDSDTADFVISDGSMSKQEFDQLAHKLEVALPMKQYSQLFDEHLYQDLIETIDRDLELYKANPIPISPDDEAAQMVVLEKEIAIRSLQASALEKKGQYTRAIDIAKWIFRKSPETIDRDLYLTLTQSYIKSGQLELALPHLDSLLRNHPQDKWGYLAKAGCLYQLRRFEDSIAACDVGYSVGADLPPAATLDANENLLITKGLCYNSLGSFSAAIEQFDLCLSINPTQLRALELKGGCLKQKGLHQEALETFDKFIMTVGEQSTGYGPTRLPAIYVNRGVCFKALGRVEAALSSFTSAISSLPESNPLYVEAIINKGMILFELRRFQEALQALEKASALAPGNNRLLPVLIQLYGITKRFPEALAVCEKASIVSPNDPMPMSQKATVLFSLGRVNEALKVADQAVALNPNFVPSRLIKMKCLIGAGRFHDAVFLGEETVKIDPNSAQAYTVKAEAHKALGQTTQMQSALMTAMRINPNLASKFQSSLEYNSAPMPTALDIVEVK